MDLSRLRRDLHPRLGCGMVHLSGNERVKIRRSAKTFKRLVNTNILNFHIELSYRTFISNFHIELSY